jgi:hypothetical protein
MKKFMFALALCTLTQVSCKKDDDEKTTDLVQGTLAGKSYYVVDGGDLERSESSIKGSGSVVYASPLGAITSKDNYALNFTLEDGGSLELVTHSNSSLANGVSVLFSRSGNALSAILKAKGTESAATELSGIDAADTVAVSVDVHNDETPAHILLWSSAAGSFGEEDALLNSEGGEETPGNGTGTAWGLVLKKASVTSAVIADPKFVE